MLTLIVAAAAALGLPQEAAPRSWNDGDPGVRFVEGTTSPPIATLGDWRGQVVIKVRCMVEADGSLTSCDVIEESRARRINHRSARVEVGQMRLQLGEDGPRPGDTLTVQVVITRG